MLKETTHPLVHEKKSLTRIGAYGVVIESDKILLVTQAYGFFKGKFDLPGGGIEFGESVEEALRREFAEEVGMAFESAASIGNWTNVHEAPKREEYSACTFYQIGLIYKPSQLKKIHTSHDLLYRWYSLDQLQQSMLSPFASTAVNLFLR